MDTPRYEYSRGQIQERINHLKSLKVPYGYTLRYALKANPHKEIVQMMMESGVHFDASSSYEAEDLLEQGVPGQQISLSSQQSPHNLEKLLAAGVLFVATSLKQLGIFLNTPGRPDRVGLRINPNIKEAGHNNRTSTGGVAASFGIWHEYAKEAREQAEDGGVKVDRVHIHIGSGVDPKAWDEVMKTSLAVVEMFSDATSLDIGGGYKVHRYGDEKETDMEAIFKVFSERLLEFKDKTGREIELEIEPGTYFIAHAGTLVATIDDIVDTGKGGYSFLRLDTGMNDFLRSAMYGAQHKIEVMNNATKTKEYVVVGHNCESGDIFTPAPRDAEYIEPRLLKEAEIGDEVRIYDTGAYCEGMSAKGYNSFPSATGVMVD